MDIHLGQEQLVALAMAGILGVLGFVWSLIRGMVTGAINRASDQIQDNTTRIKKLEADFVDRAHLEREMLRLEQKIETGISMTNNRLDSIYQMLADWRKGHD